jgi:hypothetical protein
MKDVAERCVKA